jgi:hypothetical protein
MKPVIAFLLLWAPAFSLDPNKARTIEFEYPGRSATVTMETDLFKKFEKEWRGTDYYYSAESKDGMICSVLFFKLSKDQVKEHVARAAQMLSLDETSPALPLKYFSENADMKQYETNEKSWGDPKGSFMFRSTDVPVYGGQEINQKKLFAYTQFNKELFVSIELSKVDCSNADFSTMRNMMASLQKKPAK